ncbi:MAG: cell envelope integrity protein TolA [Deltaproteobacteria bacterium]|nr:cell envelope integrity protein TolA [Deltaproteobacteria bacterium]
MKLSAQLYPELEKERILKWMIALSFGLHVVLFASILFLPGLQPSREPFTPAYTVDLVSMAGFKGELPGPKASAEKPIKTIVPLTKARKIAVASAPEPAVVDKPEAIPILKPKDVSKAKVKPAPAIDNVDDAVEKLQKEKEARAKVEKQTVEKQKAEKQTVSREKELQKALQDISAKVQSRTEAVVDEGAEQGAEQGEEGNGGLGTADVGLRLQIYKTNIWNKVRSNWSYPDIMSGGFGPEALVMVKVQRDGSIVGFRLVKPSGDQLFDQSVLRAVQHSNPFPPFPDGYVKSYEEIELRFSLADLRRG